MQSCHLPTSRRSYQEKVGTVLITVLLLYYYRTSANQLHILLTIPISQPNPYTLLYSPHPSAEDRRDQATLKPLGSLRF